MICAAESVSSCFTSVRGGVYFFVIIFLNGKRGLDRAWNRAEPSRLEARVCGGRCRVWPSKKRGGADSGSMLKKFGGLFRSIFFIGLDLILMRLVVIAAH
jgi:hypothetical protein